MQYSDCDYVSDREELSLRIFLGKFGYSVDVCAHNDPSSESRLCLLSADAYVCSPLPSGGFRGRLFREPCGSPPSPVLWGHKTARPSFRAPFGRPSGTAYLRTNTPAQRRRGALLGSWAIPLEACSGLGTPATPAQPRKSGRTRSLPSAPLTADYGCPRYCEVGPGSPEPLAR